MNPGASGRRPPGVCRLLSAPSLRALWRGGLLASVLAIPAWSVHAADGTATTPPDSARGGPTRPAKPIAQQIAEADSIIRLRGGSHADDARLFLSWNAPWGQRRARRERIPACADSTVEDTLYLCVRTGREADQFLGFTAELMVMATGRDTLGAWWHMQGKGGQNPGAMRVDWSAAQDWGVPQPFRQQGQGFILLEPSRQGARIKLIFAVSTESRVPPAPDSVYALARLVLRHMPQRGLPGCASPVVIEWTKATLALSIRDEPTVAQGERHVSYGGPYSLTEPFRGSRPEAWKPPPRTPAAPPGAK